MNDHRRTVKLTHKELEIDYVTVFGTVVKQILVNRLTLSQPLLDFVTVLGISRKTTLGFLTHM